MSGADYEQQSFLRRWLFRDWLHRATVLLTGLLLLQFALWAKEEGALPGGALSLIIVSMLVVGALELLPRLHWAWRRAAQLVLLVIQFAAAVKYHPEPIRLHSWLGDLAGNVQKLFPTAFIGVAVWAVYLLALWWVSAKGRIYILLLISVLSVAIRDSFTALILWDQEAVIVFSGIGLLIVHHFIQLRKKDPASWNYLAEYPGAIALPVVLLITLTLGLGISMPELPPLVTDPYTAWKQWMGEPITPMGKGVNYAVGQLDTSSGYSRNDEELGGGFNFDSSPIMTVDTTQRSYWRGETRSLYTGSGWVIGESDRRSAGSALDKLGTELPGDLSENTGKLKTVEVVQTYTMMNDQRYPAMFGANYIDKVTAVTDLDGTNDFTQPGSLSWLQQSSTLRWFSRSLPYPKSYAVVSQMPVLDEAGLRAAGTAAYSGPEWRDELQLPDTLPARVRQLAEDVTKTAANPYDKVKALETYLSTTYPYKNKPDLSKGKSKDFVDRFLFEIKEGYCDYYSTAMVVMTRSLGIPARWVKGFTSGMTADEEMDPELAAEEMDPSGAGTYTVRNSDAHSWVEVYFDGYGWIPFEPTAGFALPLVVPPDEPLPLPVPGVDDAASLNENAAAKWVRIGAWVFAALIAAAAVLFLWRRRVFSGFTWPGGRRALDTNQRIVLEFNRFLRHCLRKGFVRHDHETAREALRRWADNASWMKDDLTSLLAVFERAKYGRATLTEQDLQRTNDILQKLRQQM